MLDAFLPWLTHLGSHIAVIAFLAGTWVVSGKMGLFQSVALLYCFISGIVYGLKYLVRRRRPPLVVNRKAKVEKGPGEILDPSFPSAHTAYAFMMATLLAHWFPSYRGLFFFAAAFIGWTRIYLDLHYPTDALGGALVGLGATLLSVYLWPGFSLPR